MSGYCRNLFAGKISGASRLYVVSARGNRISLYFNEHTSVAELKLGIHERMCTPPDQQRIVWSGQQLEDAGRLYDYGLQSGDRVHVCFVPRRC